LLQKINLLNLIIQHSDTPKNYRWIIGFHSLKFQFASPNFRRAKVLESEGKFEKASSQNHKKLLLAEGLSF